MQTTPAYKTKDKLGNKIVIHKVVNRRAQPCKNGKALCGNRRHGSAYCEKCSIAHNKKK